MIAIIDYGVGNLASIGKIFRRFKMQVSIASDPSTLAAADKMILPGVGHFAACMENLRASGLLPSLEDQVLGMRKPILGICVGMQLMSKRSSEGDQPGLGWFPGVTVKLPEEFDGRRLAVPHVGWNVLQSARGPLFEGLAADARFYFSHSYAVQCDETALVAARTEYGGPFVSVIEHGNILGLQFHPEKSHQAGVTVMRNFAERY